MRPAIEVRDLSKAFTIPSVRRETVREYYRQHGLLELYDAIEKAR